MMYKTKKKEVTMRQLICQSMEAIGKLFYKMTRPKENSKKVLAGWVDVEIGWAIFGF